MKRHYITVSIDNLPDDIDESVANVPDNLKVSFDTYCNNYSLAVILTYLIRICAEHHPDAVKLHCLMLANGYLKGEKFKDD